MAKRESKTGKKVAAAFREIKKDPPAILAKTARKSGEARAEKQRVAIGLSKARAAGARIPEPNYVSNSALHVPSGATPGECGGSERVPYKKAASAPVAENALGHFAGAKSPGEDMSGFKHADLNPVERERQKNNRCRDMRSNLGRGKAGVVEVE